MLFFITTVTRILWKEKISANLPVLIIRNQKLKPKEIFNLIKHKVKMEEAGIETVYRWITYRLNAEPDGGALMAIQVKTELDGIPDESRAGRRSDLCPCS